MSSQEYSGSATTNDGRRVSLTSDQAKELWEGAMAAKEQRAIDMPTSADALRVISGARQRMRDLGWSDGVYCPKDGTLFEVTQFGSAGQFTGVYHGEWPSGKITVFSEGDCEYTHPHGCMWRPLQKEQQNTKEAHQND